MASMFTYAAVFNQNLNSWNVAAVTRIDRMFDRASAFNGDISAWNVGQVADYGTNF